LGARCVSGQVVNETVVLITHSSVIVVDLHGLGAVWLGRDRTEFRLQEFHGAIEEGIATIWK